MEKISRKGFLKVAAAAAMSGVTAGALAACNGSSASSGSVADAIYTPLDGLCRTADAFAQIEERTTQ